MEWIGAVVLDERVDDVWWWWSGVRGYRLSRGWCVLLGQFVTFNAGHVHPHLLAAITGINPLWHLLHVHSYGLGMLCLFVTDTEPLCCVMCCVQVCEEPNAMAVASCSSDGQPSLRYVLLKGVWGRDPPTQ
jgi:hypothetical protein